ncbi:MAG: VOC family protein [Propionicimonas sp.]|nr:VOC family protein [Propionicimonas sp.]
MRANRSMPEGSIIPVLAYESVTEAVEWLCRAFGFRLRWQIADHRAQLAVDERSAIAVVQGRTAAATADHVMIRVDDVDSHRERARAEGAHVGEVGEHVFGERQYTAVDPAGRSWVFTQSVADVAPEQWGAATGPARAQESPGRVRTAARSVQGAVRARVRARKTRS